jgi:sugar lactone lactonase YvrE
MSFIPTGPQLFAVLALSALSPAAFSAAPQLTSIASGLNNPRHLAFAPNGRLYVAEAGIGAGDGHGGFGIGVGLTGSITEITGVATATPTAKRIVTGLVSVGGTENGFPEVVGADGLAIQGTGNIYVTLAESTAGIAADSPDLSAAAAMQLGRLIKVAPSGQWKPVADVGGFDYQWTLANQNAPWAPAGQFPDANPYGLCATGSRQFVVDAGANTIDEVRADGTIRVVAYVPNPLLPRPSGGPAVIPISDAVPTGVTMGPDGYLYVGTLAFGANFARFSPSAPPLWGTLPPQSKIYRVDPNASNQFLTEADVWAAGFDPITSVTFGKGAVYVTEFVTQASGYLTGAVVRVAVNPDGSAGAKTTLGAGALVAPNGIALGPNDEVYVSNFSISSGGGEVVRVND